MIVSIVRPAELRLDDHGMTLRTFGGSKRFDWAKCSEFGVSRLPVRGAGSMVVFDYDEPRYARLKRLNRGLVGAGGGLPDKFGMSATELADLLNQYRQQEP